MARPAHAQAAPPTSQATHATLSVSMSTWTAIVTLTPTEDRALLAMMADLAALLGTRYQLRLVIDGAEQIRETVHTDQVSAIQLHGLRVASGATATLDAFHSEATAQDITGTLIHRAG